MPKLGSKGRPAIVRVQTEERAAEMMEIADTHGWQIIVGIETDKPEDITDIKKLLKTVGPRKMETSEQRKKRRRPPPIARRR